MDALLYAGATTGIDVGKNNRISYSVYALLHDYSFQNADDSINHIEHQADLFGKPVLVYV